ncbi:hypothetical protein HDV05_005338 [Chytridiales sp. JEL 0842]|nr:hypothetical protein HDV05_005338 [Chytridiales sp. JEL 0842]
MGMLENASWRKFFQIKFDLKTIDPATLNWQKDNDVCWLYGPFHTYEPLAVLQAAYRDAEALSNAKESPRGRTTSDANGIHGATNGISAGKTQLKSVLKRRAIPETLLNSFREGDLKTRSSSDPDLSRYLREGGSILPIASLGVAIGSNNQTPKTNYTTAPPAAPASSSSSSNSIPHTSSPLNPNASSSTSTSLSSSVPVTSVIPPSSSTAPSSSSPLSSAPHHGPLSRPLTNGPPRFASRKADFYLAIIDDTSSAASIRSREPSSTPSTSSTVSTQSSAKIVPFSDPLEGTSTAPVPPGKSLRFAEDVEPTTSVPTGVKFGMDIDSEPESDVESDAEGGVMMGGPVGGVSVTASVQASAQKTTVVGTSGKKKGGFMMESSSDEDDSEGEGEKVSALASTTLSSLMQHPTSIPEAPHVSSHHQHRDDEEFLPPSSTLKRSGSGLLNRSSSHDRNLFQLGLTTRSYN